MKPSLTQDSTPTASGNRTYDGRNHDRGRLVEANGVQYIVGGLGQWVAKIQSNDTVYYHYDQSRHLIAESDSQGSRKKDKKPRRRITVALVFPVAAVRGVRLALTAAVQSAYFCFSASTWTVIFTSSPTKGT